MIAVRVLATTGPGVAARQKHWEELLVNAEEVVEESKLFSFSVQTRQPRVWDAATRSPMDPNSNFCRYKDNIFAHTVYVRLLFGAFFGMRPSTREALAVTNRGSQDDVMRTVIHAMEFGGAVLFPKFVLVKSFNEAGGMVQACGGVQARLDATRSQRLAALTWADERATTGTKRKRLDQLLLRLLLLLLLSQLLSELLLL